MNAIGSMATVNYFDLDRTARIQRIADVSDGQRTVEQVTKMFDESDRVQLIMAAGEEAIRSGTMPGFNAEDVARAESNFRMSLEQKPGPITIDAMDVERVVATSAKLQGWDLRAAGTYARHLHHKLDVALSIKPDVTFTGSWGKDRITHDINEYVGWMMQAMQHKAQPEPVGPDATSSNP